MFRNFLALFLVLFLAPALAFAESAAPCKLLDREALTSLNLGAHTMKVERKETPGEKGAPPVTVHVCAYTLATGELPTLNVTTTAMPAGIQTLKPSCTQRSSNGLELFICTAIVRNTFATFILSTKPFLGIAMKSQFPAEIERLMTRLAEPGSKGTSAR